jgi:hypothetical protein
MRCDKGSGRGLCFAKSVIISYKKREKSSENQKKKLAIA